MEYPSSTGASHATPSVVPSHTAISLLTGLWVSDMGMAQLAGSSLLTPAG